MPSNSETGHAKNVANFETLISYCTGYGATYNPTNAALKLPALNTLLANARAALEAVSTAEAGFKNSVNLRQQLFKPVKPLSTKAINALVAAGANASTVANARTIVRKINGQRVTGSNQQAAAGTQQTTPATPKRSSSQQSFDYLIEHFTALKDVLEQEPLYTPEEADIKVAAIQTKITELRGANASLNNAEVVWSNKRIDRDNTLYQPGTGLVDTAQAVKAYVKSVFGGSSPQYKQISALTIKTL